MTASIRMRRWLPALVLGLLTPSAFAQTVLFAVHGDDPDDRLGWPVSGAGDVNADGIPDIIVGIFGDDTNGEFAGSARVYSGLDGTILHTFFGTSAGDSFGTAVSGVGDINGDGADDVIVGAWFDDDYGPHRGTARVFSGADGSILYTFGGATKGGRFGISASGAGDVNGDGIPDMIVGAPMSSNAGVYWGSAYVFSGADGSVLHRFDGDGPNTGFGASVSSAGDVNGDGFADLLVGAPGHWHIKKPIGRAFVFSGQDGSTLLTLSGNMNADRFGSSVSSAGDVNGDGLDDLVVGAPNDGEENSGRAWIFSGANGSVLSTLHGSRGDTLGGTVSGVGDLNGDGFGDVLIGAAQYWYDDGNPGGGGYALLVSGRDAAVIHRFVGDTPYDQFGIALSGVGDVDGDGIGDLIFGTGNDDTNGEWSGTAWVFSGPRGGINYCGPANFNSTGQSALISAYSTTSPTSPVDPIVLTMIASRLPPNSWGYFLNSDQQRFKAFVSGSQGNLCLGGGIGRHLNQVKQSGPAGRITIEVDLTALPRPGGGHTVIVGETWNFQCWFRDANPMATSNLTDGISFTF